MTQGSPHYPDDSFAQADGRIPGTGQPAFRLWADGGAAVPILLAAPHGGRVYPAEELLRMREPEYALLRLEDRHVDLLARVVAQQTGAWLLLAEAPRALLDLNRSPDDVDWEMIASRQSRPARHSSANRRARSGLGLVPRRLPGLGEIWRTRLSDSDLAERVDAIHRPYHAALAAAMERLRDQWGAALLIDLHSMPPLKARHPDEKPAEFVIGDRFGAACGDGLVASALRHLGRSGRPVAHNRPYSGGYVLDRHSAPARGLHAMQLEVCRSTYLDARFDQPSARLPAVARLIAGLVRSLAQDVAVLGNSGTMAQAAE